MTIKRFCNKCKKECTHEKMTLPGKLTGGYFLLWQLFQHNEDNPWTLCQDCLDSFIEDLNTFLKKQGYETDDLQSFGASCREYFKKMELLAG